MEEAIRRFLTNLEAVQGRAENTLLAYRADLRQLEQVLTQQAGRVVPLTDLTPERLAAYSTWLTQQRYRPATLSRKIAAVRSFLEYLRTREGIGGAELIAELRPPPTPRRRPRVLAPHEVTALLEAPSQAQTPRGLRDAAILAVLYATGMRAADAVALRLSDVDVEGGQVSLASNWRRPIPLGAASDPMRRYLEQGRPHLAREPEATALFLNQRGRALSRQGLWLVVKRWAAAAGVGQDVSPHSLRHSLAQHLLGEGRTRREVQQILGLSSPNSIRVHREEEPT